MTTAALEQRDWQRRQAREWGRNLRTARQRRFTTIRQLVLFLHDQFGLSITEAVVGQYERGETMPSDWVRYHLSRAVEVPEATLFAYTVPVPQVLAA